MNIAPLQSLIQRLDEQLVLLGEQKQELVQKHEGRNSRSQEMQALFNAGRPVPTEFFGELQKLGEEFNKQLQLAISALQAAAGIYQTASSAVKGFAIQSPGGDNVAHLVSPATDYNVEEVVQALVELSGRITDLKATIQEYLERHARVEEILGCLTSEIGPALVSLRANVDVDAVLQEKRKRAENPKIKRELLIAELEQLRQDWEEKERLLLTADILENYEKIDAQLGWLKSLNALKPQHWAFTNSIDPDDFEPSMELLAQSNAALTLCQQDTATALEQLNIAIADTAQAAYTQLERIHEAMPETRALRGLVTQYTTTPERELPHYYERLKSALESARMSGSAAIYNYRASVKNDPAYAFADRDELWQIGAALLAVADDPDEYKGELWVTGEDALLRALSDGALDIDEFYAEFGYPIIVRALAAAADRNEIIHALGFLNHFLPEDARPEEAVLANDDVSRVLAEAAQAGQLWIAPTDVETLDEAGLRAALSFLRHASAGLVPERVKLQWLAVFHETLKEEAPLRVEVDLLLAETLMEARQWLLLYYALAAMGAGHPEFWREPRFRAMLCPLIGRALEQGESGQELLHELALSEQIRQLAGDHAGSQFVIASLRHRLAVDAGDDQLLSNKAVAAWNEVLEVNSPLKNLLYRELDGARFSADLWVDKKDLEYQYNDLLEQLRARVNAIPRLRDVRTAIAIYRWYQEEYWFQWLKKLDIDRSVSDRQIRDLLEKIRIVAREQDLVDFSPANREPPPGAEIANPLEGNLEAQLNNLLRSIIDQFKEAAELREQLILTAKRELPPRPDLDREVAGLSRDGSMAWAIARLLSPSLSFLIQLGGDPAGGNSHDQ
jgi:hypothetical protein